MNRNDNRNKSKAIVHNAALYSPPSIGAAHIGRNSRRQRAGRQEQGRREDFHLADDHGDSQGFTQSAGQAQDDAGEDTALGGRKYDVGNCFPARRAEAIRSFTPRLGHGGHGIGGHGRNGRENHDSQDNAGS